MTAESSARKPRVRFVDHIVYLIARVAIGLAARVPERISYGFAAWLGRVYFWCAKRRQRYALHFLKNAYPDRDDRELLRLGAVATGNLFQIPLDMARFTRLIGRGGHVDEVVDFSAAEEYLGTEPPYVAVSAHLGSWELAGAAMASRAGEAHGLSKVGNNPLLYRWIVENRGRADIRVHPRRGGFRAVKSALERGRIGLQVVDQNQRLRGVFAPFFGEVASCERAAVTLCLRQRYPIVVGAALRVDNRFRFRLVLLPPFVPEATGDKAKDIYEGVLRVNQGLEELIRMAPEQYLWIHDRYRKKPPPGWRPGCDAEAEAGDDEGEGDGEARGSGAGARADEERGEDAREAGGS